MMSTVRRLAELCGHLVDPSARDARNQIADVASFAMDNSSSAKPILEQIIALYERANLNK